MSVTPLSVVSCVRAAGRTRTLRDAHQDLALMRVWKTGEPVRVTFAGQTRSGTVLLASANGKSLALKFDALLGGYLGTMPVLWDGTSFRDLITHEPVELS